MVGCRLHGKLRPGVTSTDLVLTVTQILRKHKLVDKFIEYFGPGVEELTLPDRATIANMTPENGSTMGFFPVDRETIRFLRLTGRDEAQVALVEAYCKAQGMWREPSHAAGGVHGDRSRSISQRSSPAFPGRAGRRTACLWVLRRMLS